MINTKIARITVVLIGLLLPLQAVATQTRPNIVHIALEDITPLMGCYGDKYAKTPTFDQLAAEGIRYTHAYGKEEGFGDNRGKQPPNYWNTRGKGPNWNGELKPGPNETGFDYSYVIPVANSFPPYVIVENHRLEGLRKDSPNRRSSGRCSKR